MKKLLAALLILGSLFFMPAALAEIETYTGEGKATMSEAETLEKVIERAKTYALRNAREKAGVYIRSQSRLRDLELVEDEVVTLTSGILKIKDSKVEKTLVNDAIQVYVIVTVTVDSDDLQREIDKFLARNPNRKPEPPNVEKTKPKEKIEPSPPPAPPVEKPKPVEKFEPPPSPLIPSIEQSKPVGKIDPTAPIKTVNPPMDDEAMANELIKLLNKEREKAGKKAFIPDDILMRGAEIRSRELARKISTDRPNGTKWWTVLPVSYQQRVGWEYYFWGYNSPQECANNIINSKEAKWKDSAKRIFTSDLVKIGVAHFYKEDSEHKHYWVLFTFR